MKTRSRTDDRASKRPPAPGLPDLDIREAQQDIEKDPAYGRYLAFADQCREALNATRDVFRQASTDRVSRVLVAGMGGSSIAGDFLSALSAHRGDIPVQVVRGFSLPAWTDASTLVIACSHSGETEETLALFEHARDRGATCVAVTTGGQLASLATDSSIDCLRYVFPSEPRTAFAPIFVRLLAVACRTHSVDVSPSQLEASIRSLETLRSQLDSATPVARNPAKQLAIRLRASLPLLIGGSYLARPRGSG
jgi:glucose/mannose-6-phosphate isomerase